MSKFMNKMMNIVGLDYGEDYEDSYIDPVEEDTTYFDDTPAFDRLASRRSSRVVKLRESADPQQMKVVVTQPQCLEEARDITDHLKRRKPIVVNLETVEKEVARRIVDFLSGSVYALDGEMQKVSNGIFLIAPNNVGIQGEEIPQSKGRFPWEN